MEFRLSPFRDADLDDAIAVFNHYIKHSFAAYGEEPMTRSALRTMVAGCGRLPKVVAHVVTDGAFAGFGFLRPYSPLPSFSRTACITYFLAPNCTRKGLGSLILSHLEREAAYLGISELLAHLSSLNPASLAFHRKVGFAEVGRFRQIGAKHGEVFDVLWMQKTIRGAG